MVHKVFRIEGDKLASLVIDEKSLKFSSKNYDSLIEFQESWNKNGLFKTELEIQFNYIKSIIKDENSNEIRIKYVIEDELTWDCEFSFVNEDDYAIFFNYFEKEQNYRKYFKLLSPFDTIKNNLLWLVGIIGFTIFSYYKAVDITNGIDIKIATPGTTGRFYKMIIGFIGEKGVLIVGIVFVAYLSYEIWKSLKKTPNRIKLLPPPLS